MHKVKSLVDGAACKALVGNIVKIPGWLSEFIVTKVGKFVFFTLQKLVHPTAK